MKNISAIATLGIMAMSNSAFAETYLDNLENLPADTCVERVERKCDYEVCYVIN